MLRAVNKFKADFGGLVSLERVQQCSDHVPHRYVFIVNMLLLIVLLLNIYSTSYGIGYTRSYKKIQKMGVSMFRKYSTRNF